MIAILCAILLALSCLFAPTSLPAPSPDDDQASVLLLQSENQGASSRPLHYGPAGVPK